MKTMCSNQRVVRCVPGERAGMTLVEVIVALAITGLTVAGIVAGYIYCTTAAVKGGLVQAASARALERIEEVHSARWDTSVFPVVDQLVGALAPLKLIAGNASLACPDGSPVRPAF